MRRATAALLGTVTACLLLGACGTGSDDTSDVGTASASTTQRPDSQSTTADSPTSDPTTEPTTTSPTTEAPTTAPTTTPPEDEGDADPAFPTDTSTQFAESSGEWDLVLTDVRVGEHEGFDRIVLEFTGTGVPGWSVGWVDRARLDGSGEAVDLDGDAVLDVYASGTTWPADGYYDGPQRLEPDGGEVDDVYVGGTFEGYTQVLAGVDGAPVPVRVFALAAPPRLVVDVADSAD
jgi:hypothetical protein